MEVMLTIRLKLRFMIAPQRAMRAAGGSIWCSSTRDRSSSLRSRKSLLVNLPSCVELSAGGSQRVLSRGCREGCPRGSRLLHDLALCNIVGIV
jgi:hypothetical protein